MFIKDVKVLRNVARTLLESLKEKNDKIISRQIEKVVNEIAINKKCSFGDAMLFVLGE